MLNGPASTADAYGPSVMPFVGLEVAAYKQQLWEWDAVAATTAAQHPLPTASSAAFTTNTTTYAQQPFYTDSSCTMVDCCVSPSAVSASSSPSPFPQAVPASFPFYQATAPMVPDYPQAFLSTSTIKAEDLDGVSCADGVVPGRIGLNLGRRTYFSSGDAGAIDGMLRRSRGFYGHQYYGYGHYQHQVPRCQAEGCKADLSGAKHYHRRHKVCEFHSKAAVVVAGGVQQRFCQQCSRFHVLGEFDDTKRSCRKRLAEHNRRRRKPQTLPTSHQQQQKSGPSGSAVSSPGTTATADASSSPAGSTADTKSKHVAHNGGLNGPPISPNAPTASSGFVTFSDGGKSPSAEAQLRASVTGLSLGGTDGSERGVTVAATDFDSDDAFHDHSAFLFGTEEKNAQQYPDHFQHQKQQHQLFSSSSSSNTFAHHNFFCASSNDASQSTTGGCGGGGSDQSVPRSSSLLHLGQNLFDVDFME